jgi:hypothetical protein
MIKKCAVFLGPLSVRSLRFVSESVNSHPASSGLSPYRKCDRDQYDTLKSQANIIAPHSRVHIVLSVSRASIGQRPRFDKGLFPPKSLYK